MITITATANHVNVDMGALYPDFVQMRKGLWRKDQVQLVLLNTNHVEVDAAGGRSWLLNFDGGEIGYQVAAVEGVPPTSNEDLFDKIKALLI